MSRVDAWTVADPTVCHTCGREGCEEHLPSATVLTHELADVEAWEAAEQLADSLPIVAPNALQRRQRASVGRVSPAGPFNLTDAGNAEYFAAHRGADLRFDHRRGRWLVWSDHRWQPDVDGEVNRRSKAAMRRRAADALGLDDPNERMRLTKWAISSESAARLNALLSIAQSEHPIADAGEMWDGDPWLLGVPNGVVDLRAGRLRPGRRDDAVTMSAGVAFNPRAACPRWRRFVEEIFAGDAALVSFVHRAIGYSLTGDTREQCLFLLHGTGANGKSTFVDTLIAVLGDYGHVMPFSTIEKGHASTIPNDVAALVGRRCVVASETTDGARLNEGRLKSFTGNEPISARFLNQEFFTFRPVGKFWLSANHRPVVRDDSRGFWRRMRLIPFTQTFALNPTLADELRAEAAGILAWAVEGALLWQRDGLAAPAVVLDATRDYERESDPLMPFLDEACELEGDAEVGAAELFDHYLRWAEMHSLTDRERLSSTMFGRKFGERFSHTKRGPRKVYLGVSRRSFS